MKQSELDAFSKKLTTSKLWERLLKNASKETIEQISTMCLESCESRLSEIKIEEEERVAKKRAIEKTSLAVKDTLVENNISVSELVQSLTSAEQIYVYIDEDGKQCRWSGQGRMPAPMKKQIDNGTMHKEDFLLDLSILLSA